MTVVPASAEIRAATAAFLTADLPVIAAQFTKQFGLKNVDDKMKAITALVEKWKRIVANWDGSPDTLADLYWNELFSKLDVASYGLD